jgi:hypothetical protein
MFFQFFLLTKNKFLKRYWNLLGGNIKTHWVRVHVDLLGLIPKPRPGQKPRNKTTLVGTTYPQIYVKYFSFPTKVVHPACVRFCTQIYNPSKKLQSFLQLSNCLFAMNGIPDFQYIVNGLQKQYARVLPSSPPPTNWHASK